MELSYVYARRASIESDDSVEMSFQKTRKADSVGSHRPILIELLFQLICITQSHEYISIHEWLRRRLQLAGTTRAFCLPDSAQMLIFLCCL